MDADTVTWTNCSLSQFEIISPEAFTLVNASKPTTCILEPIPSKFSISHFPWTLCPLPLKLPLLNCYWATLTLICEFWTIIRPISNLPVMSKLLERAVSDFQAVIVSNNNLSEKFQSGSRSRHSTETVLTRVVNDLLITVDSHLTSLFCFCFSTWVQLSTPWTIAYF